MCTNGTAIESNGLRNEKNRETADKIEKKK